jgi:hypothetical protein
MELGLVGVIKYVWRYCSEVHLYLCIRHPTRSKLFCQGILHKNKTHFSIYQTDSARRFSLHCELHLSGHTASLHVQFKLIGLLEFKIVGLVFNTWVKCNFVNNGLSLAQANDISPVHTGYRKTGLVWKCGTPAPLSTPSCLLLVVLSSSPGISKPHRGPSPFRILAALCPSLVPTCYTSTGKQMNFSWNQYPAWIIYEKFHFLLLAGYRSQGQVLCK